MEDIQNKALNVNEIGTNEIGTNEIVPNAIGPNATEILSSDHFILNKDGHIIGIKNTTPKKKNESVMGYF